MVRRKCMGFARHKNYALLGYYETPKVLLHVCTLRVSLSCDHIWCFVNFLSSTEFLYGYASKQAVLVFCAHEKNLLLSPAEASIGCFPLAFHTLRAEGTWICSFIWSLVRHWDARTPSEGPFPPSAVLSCLLARSGKDSYLCNVSLLHFVTCPRMLLCLPVKANFCVLKQTNCFSTIWRKLAATLGCGADFYSGYCVKNCACLWWYPAYF